MTALPSMAVITPVHNGMPFLRETLDSVAAQDYPGIETIIVDDASTDGSGSFARQHGCRVIEASGVGPAAARNLGIKAADSEFLYFLDADDLLASSGVLQTLVAVLSTNTEAGFAQGFIQNFEAGCGEQPHIVTRPYRFLNLGSMLWRRDCFERVGLFDESLRLCEDLDFLMRCWEQDVSRILVEKLVLLYRRHQRQMTTGLNGAGFGTMRAYKKRIERIQTGQYDPNAPRMVDWTDYLGMAPDRQDRISA